MGVYYSAKIVYGYKISGSDQRLSEKQRDKLEALASGHEYKLMSTDYYTSTNELLFAKELVEARESESVKIGRESEEVPEAVEEELKNILPFIRHEEPGFYLCQVVW